MDPELWDVIKRYTLVGVVLMAAAVWSVQYTTDVSQPANAAPSLEARTAPEALDAGAASEAQDDVTTVVRHGLRRVRCEAACAVESKCGLRARDVCINESCEGDVRKLTKSDAALVQAGATGTCEDAAASACSEACWRQAECKDDHAKDDACTQGCLALMKDEPAKTWLQARCILETKSCDVVARCRE